MNKKLSCVLTALLVFSLNAMPVEAAKKKAKVEVRNSKAKKQLILAPGQHCFQLAWVSLYCFQL